MFKGQTQSQPDQLCTTAQAVTSQPRGNYFIYIFNFVIYLICHYIYFWLGKYTKTSPWSQLGNISEQTEVANVGVIG